MSGETDGIAAPLNEESPMTLARGNIRGYEYDRMVLSFSMMDGAREVSCAVSASAMDDLEHVSRTAPERREEQFLRLRDQIEQRASRKFVAKEFEGNPAGIILRSIDFRG
jgi:Protein of unknown function (DUF1488)